MSFKVTQIKSREEDQWNVEVMMDISLTDIAEAMMKCAACFV
jgi:hypothetical protein